MLRSLQGRLPHDAIVTVVVCTLLAVSQSVNVYLFLQNQNGTTWRFVLVLMLPTWVLMFACAPLIRWLARAYSFGPDDRARSALIHVACGIAFSLLHNVAVAINRVLLLPPETHPWDRVFNIFRLSLAYLWYQDVLAYGVLLAMFLTLHYSDLRVQLANARLTALRAQINPHFFFNTLNSVSTLALQGRRDDVAEIVGRLGDLMRTALNEQAQEVRLAAELAFVDDYLAIQHVRFGERFHVCREIAPDTLDAVLPSLVLQPILENAVEYGLAKHPGVLRVTIAASRRNDDLLIEISDTGPGFTPGARREGIGLSNTRARLSELYGHRCRFEYGNLPAGGAVVRLSVPFRLGPRVSAGHTGLSDYRLPAAERTTRRA